MQWGLWIVGAYLVGAVPFGFLMGRARGVDIREHGSGNIGATNAMRVLGKKLGITAFVLDVLKGAAPVLASGVVMGTLDGVRGVGEAALWLGVGIAAVVGHVFPVYLRFKGGKGVATSFGVLACYWPVVTPAAGIALLVWVVVLKASRYVSVASVAAAIALPTAVIAALTLGWRGYGLETGWPFAAVALAVAGLVVVRHRGNLSRVLKGTEPTAGRKK